MWKKIMWNRVQYKIGKNWTQQQCEIDNYGKYAQKVKCKSTTMWNMQKKWTQPQCKLNNNGSSTMWNSITMWNLQKMWTQQQCELNINVELNSNLKSTSTIYVKYAQNVNQQVNNNVNFIGIYERNSEGIRKKLWC